MDQQRVTIAYRILLALVIAVAAVVAYFRIGSEEDRAKNKADRAAFERAVTINSSHQLDEAELERECERQYDRSLKGQPHFTDACHKELERMIAKHRSIEAREGIETRR